MWKTTNFKSGMLKKMFSPIYLLFSRRFLENFSQRPSECESVQCAEQLLKKQSMSYRHCHILFSKALLRERESSPVYPGRKQVVISTISISRTWSVCTGEAAPTVTVQYLQSWDGGLGGLISVCKGSDWLDGWQTNTLPNINTPACVSACRRGRVHMSSLLFRCATRRGSNLPQMPNVTTKPHLITVLTIQLQELFSTLLIWFQENLNKCHPGHSCCLCCVQGAAGRTEGRVDDALTDI